MADDDNLNTETGDILSLTTILARPKIRIDGAEYEITAPGELTIEQNFDLDRLGKKLAGLRQSATLNEAQRKQLRRTLNAISDIILAPVPSGVRKALNDAHKIAVIEVFTLLLRQDKVAMAGGAIKAMMKTVTDQFLGEKQSPGSNGSTAEAPGAG